MSEPTDRGRPPAAPPDAEPADHGPVEVLVVDPSPRMVERLAAALAEDATPAEEDRHAEGTAAEEGAAAASDTATSDAAADLRLSRVARWTEAAARIDRGEVDAVLLVLPGGDQGILPLVELRARAPELPVVVLAGAADEPLAVKAVQLGATDYLLGDRLYGTLVRRCVLHAVETERVRSRLRERQERWPPSLRPAGDAPGDAAGRVASLRSALPQTFDELVGHYGRLLDHAVEQVVYHVDHKLDADVRRLARRAGELGAGPRDVVEIHATAIKAKEQEAGPQRMRLYAAEGQVRLLELMGHLVTFYRRSSLPGTGRGGGT